MYKLVRSYRGPIKACILDWSGTTVDKYVIAPAVVFKNVFDKFKVPITMEEAREPMGLRKDLHIKAITELPTVRERWFKQYNKYPTQNDVDEMFKEFVPMQLDCLTQYSGMLPGASNTIENIRVKGIDVVGDRLYVVHPGSLSNAEERAKFYIINLSTSSVIAESGGMPLGNIRHLVSMSLII